MFGIKLESYHEYHDIVERENTTISTDMILNTQQNYMFLKK